MSHISMTKLFACLPALTAAALHAAPVPAPAIAEAQLRAINHRHVQAFAVADLDYMDALTGPDFLLIGAKGDWIDRAQHLNLMRTPAVNNVSYDEVRVRLFGTVALLHGVFEAKAGAVKADDTRTSASGDQGATLRVRYTDVYHWNGSAWRLVGGQNTLMREGVTKPMVLGKLPEFSPWQGKDPTGDDLEVLRQLNENYVRAYREADVAWYDAHLAPEYIVLGGDGALRDRAKALADFSLPSFANTMRSFPVDQVRIRRFDNVALIHAENAYELKDGRKGVSRYTDIWQKQADGRWRCILAHITPHKAPG